MNSFKTIDDASGNTLRVGAHPVTVHVPAGSAIFAVRGEVWLTQEGLLDDIFIGPGAPFVVPGRGSLVISALRETADLFIVRPELARAHPVSDVFAFARSYAAQLRRDELGRIGAKAARELRSFTARLRSALTLRPRVTSS